MKHSWKRILCMVLAAAMLLALTIPGFAAEDEEEQEPKNGGSSVTWEKIDAKPRLNRQPLAAEKEKTPAPDEMVRVSIVLGESSVIDAGFDTDDIATDSMALQYRADILDGQHFMESVISARVLDGEKLDVVWNLTLAANAISAYVPYGKIEAIKALDGVKDVILETRYEPLADDPNMSNSTEMTGSVQVWSSGYTGAGSVIAIVDTGLDTDHELFRPDALIYAIGDDVEIMTANDVSGVWDQLHASEFLGSADGVYQNEKVPYAVNYVDKDLDVTHDNDDQGEHGSHVAGIAAANRYLPDDRFEGIFFPALDTVYTQGQAPDAQILVMKVFGKGGGAYDSDYMAAIEDAIVLGADSVNLSLGSASAGFVASDGYQDIMDSLTESDTVVVMSAGNSYSWPDQTLVGYLYSDGVNFDTVGSPGSFTNSLTVASVDNDGVTGAYITAYDEAIFYTETSGYGNAPLTSIAGEYEYVFVDGPGVDDNANVGAEGDAFMALGSEVLSGKIAVCWRGSSSFFAKANAAVAQGAAGVIIANNQAGTISMNLTGYSYGAPAVSVTQADGGFLLSAAEAVSDADGEILYYTGTLKVNASIGTFSYGSDYYTMSDFSSWGVPGDLSLKPEITAPGGNVFSVNGLTPGGQDYESMSGTSMAAPQIAGIVALVSQYIKENGLEAKTGLSRRALINSLLMSTAMPLIEEDSGSYYPVMKQGAGLVDADAAVNAGTYVLMGEDATASWADGKVKAELGDDPGRTGEYSFTFSLNNLTDEDLYYCLSADFFTQDIFPYYGMYFLDTWTALLESDVTWTADGADCDPDGVCVPASGSVEIGVSFAIPDLMYYDDRGAYVEGFVYAVGQTSEDGAMGTVHSIPVLGYFGSWLEPSMHDVGSALEYTYDLEARPPYMYNTPLGDDAFFTETYGVQYAWDDQEYALGGNPYDYDEEYLPERNAISADSIITGVYYSLIRNSAGSLFVVTDEEGEWLGALPGRAQYSAYYHVNSAAWYNTSTSADFGYRPEDLGLEEGDVFDILFYLYPEYEGFSIDDLLLYSEPIALELTVDSTAPEVTEIAAAEGELTVEIAENRYIAAVVVWDEESWLDQENGEPLLTLLGDPEEEEGAGRSVSIDLASLGLDENAHLMIEVYDYAANYVTYKLNLNEEELAAGPQTITVDPEAAKTVPGGKIYLTVNADPWGTDESVTWSSSDGSVATVDEKGVVTGVAEGTATITAVSAVNPDAVCTAEITVVVPDIDLNAAIFDEEGKVAITAINTKELLQGNTDYEILAPSDKDIIDMAWDIDGEVIYAADLSSDFTSKLYTLDPATYELTEIGGDSTIAYLGMAPTLMMTLTSGNDNESMLTCYGPYLIGIDVSTGAADLSSLVSLENDLEGGNIVGISYVGFEDDEDGFGDAYFIVDDKSVYYSAKYRYNYSEGLGVYVKKLGSFNAPVNADHYNSLYFDGVNLFWSRYSGDGNVATLYMVENVLDEAERSVYCLGSFAEDVWPVAGLIRFEFTYLTPPEFEWAENEEGGFSAVAYVTAQENPYVYIELPTEVSSEVTKAATCEENGETVYTAVATYDGVEYTDTQTVELPEATGHDWELSGWTWAEDYSSATADFVCKNDPEHVFSLDAEIEQGEIVYPTEDSEGREEYVAAVEYEDNNYSNTVTVILPALESEPEETGGSSGGSGSSGSGSPRPISETPQQEPFPFEDVKDTDWFYSDVEALWRAGFIKGTTETTYSPKDNISRAQIITILYRMDGERRVDVPFAFEDVAADAYYADAVAWASANGIVYGMSETEFAPDLDITREQFAAIVYRYARYRGLVDQPQGTLAGFKDADSVSDWAVGAMAWNCHVKLIQGVGDDTIDPKSPATRAMAAAIFNRLFKMF